MARLTRKQQKIFAENATNNGVFGSLQGNDPTISSDPDAIQGRSAYSNGWNDATYSAELLPPLEEFQGLQYLFSRQLSYLFQEGVAEWNTDTTYYTGSIVKEIDGSITRMYISTIDNNQGHLPTDTTRWYCFFDSSLAYANVSLNNLNSTGKNIGNWSTNVTNCITEIPQNIDLSVDTLYLKLKSGSKVVYPNGFEQDGTTRKFTEVTIASDLTRTDTGTGTKLPVFYIVDENRILSYANTFSGSTAPTFSGQGIWYDTTNNLIKRSVDGGSTWDTVKVAYPLGLATNDGTGYTEITQVFNGCGYIGSDVSTVFALKNVKGLIPNGKNTDGTLKNSSFDRVSVSITTLSSAFTKSNVTFDVNINALVYNDYYYDEDTNYNRYTSNDNIYNATALAVADVSNGVVTSFKIKQPFHAVDYNNAVKYTDKSMVTSWSMPSNTYSDTLTLGASGTTYTAPSNGWFSLSANSTAGNCYIKLATPTFSQQNSVENTDPFSVIMPVQKGTVVTATYSNIDNVEFKFIYAKGTESEAI